MNCEVEKESKIYRYREQERGQAREKWILQNAECSHYCFALGFFFVI